MSNLNESFQDSFDDSIEIDKAIQENAQLRELNLQKQNQIVEMQKQFDAALESIQKSNELNQENAQLKTQIYKLKSQNEELLQRLKICDQTKEDLTKKLDSTRSQSEHEHEDEINQLQAQLLSIQNQNKIENEKMKLRLQASEESSMKAQTDISVLKNQISKVISLSSNYFHKTFENANQLIDYLLHPAADKFNVQTIDHAEISKDKAKIKKLKQSLEDERSRCKQLELEVLQINQVYQTETAKSQSLVNEAADRERKLQNSYNALQNEYKQAIVNVEKKLNAKKHTMMTQTVDIDYDSLEVVKQMKQETDELNSQLVALQEDQKHKQAQIDALTAQASDIESVNNKLRQKTLDTRNQAELIIRDLNESQRKIRSLSEKLNTANREKKEIEAQLNEYKGATDDIQERYDTKVKELENVENAIELLQKQMNAQNTEIAHITNDRDHLLSLVHSQNRAIQDAESLIGRIQQDSPNDFMKPRNIASDSEEISIDKWDFGSLPEDLKDILEGIADNDGFSIPKRISQIFHVVSRWLDNHDYDNQNTIEELKRQIEKGNKTLADFVASLLNAIDEDSMDLPKITEAVSKIYKDNLTLQQKLNEIQASSQVCDAQTYNEMSEMIRNQQEMIKKLKAKSQQRKIELKECKEVFLQVNEQQSEELQEICDANEKSRAVIDQLNGEIEQLQCEKKEILDELTDTKNNHLGEYSKIQNELETLTLEQSSKLDECKSEYEHKLKLNESKMIQYENKMKETEKSVKKWELLSREAHEEIRKLKQQLHSATLEKDEQMARLNRQKEKEINQIEKQYKDMISKCEQMITETEEKIQSLTKRIEESDNEKRQMAQQMSQIQFEQQKAELRAQSQIESAERTNKLVIARLKAQLMAAETRYSVLTDEQRHALESEKRNLFGYIAQQFGPFFDVKQSLTEETFKQLITKIKSEMERHNKQEKTIRHLLKAKENQTTEDALAELIFSRHPQLQQKSLRF